MYSCVSFLVGDVDPWCILMFPFWLVMWILCVFLCFLSGLDGSLVYSYVSFLVWVDHLCILIFPFWSGWILDVFLYFLSGLDGSLVYSYISFLVWMDP